MSALVPGFGPELGFTGPAYYSYTAPAPPALEKAPAQPGFYSEDLKEFVLTYDDVRNSDSPRDTLLKFLQNTYEAGANLAQWERGALERTTK